MSGIKSFYVDTNVLILLREGHGPVQAALTELLDTALLYGVVRSTSVLTFSELLVKPLQLEDKGLIETYEGWMREKRWLNEIEISGDVLIGAALLRASNKKLKLPDAIHLASALAVKCEIFLSADMGLTDIKELTHPLRGKLPITPLKVLHPNVETLTSLTASLTP